MREANEIIPQLVRVLEDNRKSSEVIRLFKRLDRKEDIDELGELKSVLEREIARLEGNKRYLKQWGRFGMIVELFKYFELC